MAVFGVLPAATRGRDRRIGPARPDQPAAPAPAWRRADEGGTGDDHPDAPAADPSLQPLLAPLRTLEGTDYRPTDMGNALRLLHCYGANLRYVPATGMWHIWDGARWRPDDLGIVRMLAKRTVLMIEQECAGLDDKAERQARLKWAGASQAIGRIKALVETAQSEALVVASPDLFDRDAWLLNCANGTLDLRAGTLRPHRRADYITRRINVAYDPAAACPVFDVFLRDIMCGDEEMAAYVLRVLGYALSGDKTLHHLWVFVGCGNNGKSTLLNAVRGILGPYALVTRPDTLMAQRPGAISNGVADLRGARMVVAMESRPNAQLDDATVKHLASDEPIRARRLHENEVEFRPQCKIILGTNHRPLVDNGDEGTWRRLRLVEFRRTIERADKQLPLKLKAEYSGILTRLVAACRDVQHHGMQEPPAVLAATTQYRRESDVVRQWLDARTERGSLDDPRYRTPWKVLYADYERWCLDNDYPPERKNTVGRTLHSYGYSTTGATGTIVYRGIRLTTTG